MKKNTGKAYGQIHRFHDDVAVYLGDGSTVYLAPAVARQIARALNACADDIARRTFTAGTFGTHEFNLMTADQMPRKPARKIKRETVPRSFAVRVLAPRDVARTPGACTCGTCGRSWDDSIATSYTPAPSGRCPFEYYHGENGA